MLTGEAIKSRAHELGFQLCGIAPATQLPELARMCEWLDRGYAGEMRYLHKSADVRADIRRFLPSAQSVIVTGTVYYADPDAAQVACSGAAHSNSRTTSIARYAWGEDYHGVLARRLEALLEWMREQHDAHFEAAIFVDKHHVQERVFAKHAGLGWIGKNTCLINREIGSWIFLAGVAVSLELPNDAVEPDLCGACRLCIDSCPTGALADDYELDATKCISYLTIELHGPIPEPQRPGIGDHIFGCDVCQEVCPWNLTPLATLDPAWQAVSARVGADARELWQRSDFELHDLVAGSAMTRTTLSRLRRNLAIVLGNSGDPQAAGILDRPGGGLRRAALSAETPLVQQHVAWAKRALTRPGSGN
jgi:epoxyqueuosine reductase